jgi:hypothetical protein
MGNVKSGASSRLRQYVSDLKDVLFTCDGEVLFCQAC